MSNNSAMLCDAEIVELYFARDEKAIMWTDRKYRGYLLTVAQNILHDMQDSEECLNDTYVSAWNAIPPQRPHVLKVFLSTIMRRQALMKHRRMSRQKRAGDSQALSLSDFDVFLTDDSDPYIERQLRELSFTVSDFVRALPERQRYIFISRYYYGHKEEQICRELGCSRSTVSKELATIRKSFRAHLEKEGYDV